VLFVLAGVVISVAWFVFVWSGKQSDLKDARDAHATAEDKTAQLKTQLSQLEDIDAQGPKIDAEVMRLRNYVPKNPDLASFLRTANDLSVQSGVDWLSITPAEPTVDPAGGPTVITMQFEIRGGFSETLKYLDGLEKMPRLVIVDTLKLDGSDAGSDAGDGSEESVDASGAPKLKTSFTARMFTEAVPAGATVDGVPIAGQTAPAGGTTTPTTVASAAATPPGEDT
jgi:Tfp pilus assembly protein PilO